MTATIKANHLRKTFGETLAVDDMNLDIDPGEIYGLVGSDGAGKTTTMRMLVGALQNDSGEAFICGYSVSKQTELVREQIGYLSQRFSLYEDLSVLENIRFFAEVRGLSRQEWQPRCMEILTFVGLDVYKDRRAGQLSGGMRQKLGLATALVTRPKVLLLDEPTTGVDPVTRQDFWQLLIRIAIPTNRPAMAGEPEADGEEGVAILLSTPYMDEAARCRRVGFMQQGRIISEGTPSQLRSTLEGRIIELSGASMQSMRGLVENIRQVDDVRPFGDKIHLRIEKGKAEQILKRLQEAISSRAGTTIRARVVPATLEDVFISLSTDPDPVNTKQ
jgi:ABC-2 type transport system ATP-binding protein